MNQIKIDKILFPLDFSEVSPKMVPWVKYMAENFGAEVHLLYVVRRMDHLGGFYVQEVSKRISRKKYSKVLVEVLVNSLKNTFRNIKTSKLNMWLGTRRMRS